MGEALRRILLLLLFLVPAIVVVIVAIEAIRTGRFALGGDGAADAIPDAFYGGGSFLPAGVLDNAVWVIAAGIVWIVVAGLLVGLGALRDPASRGKGNG